MYLNLHLDPIFYLGVGAVLGYLLGRAHAWNRRRNR